ncbi:unnamed protein product [Rangifer tarandus platyrhynchus]|uniref:Uncharacterized protein n=1 Tax=Rangifer tarandus platyrhynchus TaxID=3082113 RepID=A0AC59ZY41_RANTA
MISVAFDPLPQQLAEEDCVCGEPAPASPTGGGLRCTDWLTAGFSSPHLAPQEDAASTRREPERERERWTPLQPQIVGEYQVEPPSVKVSLGGCRFTWTGK